MSIESDIFEFGQSIFAELGQAQSNPMGKHFLSGQLMNWSMNKPEFKVNLFRLVDVLPTLTSANAIAEHVSEYLGEPAKELHPLLKYGIDVPSSSLRAKAMGFGVTRAVKQMASMFIAGANGAEAVKAVQKARRSGFACTVDLLGEYSVSEEEAKVYLSRYLDILKVFGSKIRGSKEGASLFPGHPGEEHPINISVKLSALYSQCAPLNFTRSVSILSERLLEIVEEAEKQGATLYVDAEDSANNPIIYEVFANVFSERKDFRLPGIVLQAYARESEKTLDKLLQLASDRGGPIAVRLVKGAYWDHETVSADQHGWENPLFEQKEHSDAQYELLTRKLLDNTDLCLPAFGSHNIRSLAHACCYAESKKIPKNAFELQMLYGMAEPIAKAFKARGYLTRLYVPVGELIPGMGYLVRRLLENTSNESFLRHTFVDESDVSELLRAPKHVNRIREEE